MPTKNILRTCRYFLKFSYIGTKYKGVQRQTRRSIKNDDDSFNYFPEDDIEDGTIQAAIEKSLNRSLLPVYGSRLAISSRTDSGVHAYMNTANVDLTHPLPDTLYQPSFITNSTNRLLSYYGHEILILETKLVPTYFHSRINAKWRSYLYRVAMVENHHEYNDLPQQIQYEMLRSFLPITQLNRCHIVGHLDLNLIEKSMKLFQGKHDFVQFTTRNKENQNRSTLKSIDEFYFKEFNPLINSELRNQSSSNQFNLKFLEFFIKSESFLYNQIRRMISSILDVGLGRITLKQLELMLEEPTTKLKPMAKATLSQMVPACGLYLNEIGYNNEDFQLNDDNFDEYSPKEYYFFKDYSFLSEQEEDEQEDSTSDDE